MSGHPMLRLNGRVLSLGDQPMGLVSGSVHYWRLDPSRWLEILRRCQDLGLETICSYVPWSVHERARGVFDFEAARDVERFCGLAGEIGLKVLLRPGPHINAELTGFGFPERILNDEAIKARGPRGAPITMPAPPRSFALPSYASSRFFSEVELFFDALAPILARVLAPKGPVIALQADNENSYFFRTSPFDQDYHPEALSAFRSFLEGRYKSPEALGEAWGRAPQAFAQIDPPRQIERGDSRTLRRLLDWVEFKEELLRNGLLRIYELLRARCPEESRPLFFHNYPPCDLNQSPFDVREVESHIEIQGVDFYPSRENHRYLLKQCRSLVGSSRLPFVPEFGAGSSPWNTIVRLRDQIFTTPYIVMQGIRALNLYMFVERERWYGSPITEEGRVRPDHAAFFKPFLEALKTIRVGELEFESEVLIVVPRGYQAQQLAGHLLAPIPPLALAVGEMNPGIALLEDDYGLGRPIAFELQGILDSWIQALVARNIAFRITEDSALATWRGGEPEPAIRRLVIALSYSWMRDELAASLARWAEDGSQVWLGPELPKFGEDFKSEGEGHRALARAEAAGRVLRTSPESAPWEQVTEAWAEALAPIQMQFHRQGERRWLFLANPSSEALQRDRPKELGELSLHWGEAQASAESLDLPPWSVSIFKSEKSRRVD